MYRKLLGRRDRDGAAAAAGLELDRAGALGEDRVVLAEAGAVARLEDGAALADDDLAARDDLAGEDLHAEALRVGVAAIAARPETLLMSHRRPPSWCVCAAWAWACPRQPRPWAWQPTRAASAPPWAWSRPSRRPWASPLPPWPPSRPKR